MISGRVTDEAGGPLADVRVSVRVRDPETRAVNAGALSKQLVARSDARGDYRLEVPGITKRAIIVIDAFKPGYRSLRGPLMSAGDTKRFEVVPGSHEKADLVLKPALYFAGVVVDEQGKPIPGVSIRAYANGPRSSANVEDTESRSDGSFELFNYPETPNSFPGGIAQSSRHVHPPRLYRSRQRRSLRNRTETAGGATSCPRGGLQGDGKRGR